MTRHFEINFKEWRIRPLPFERVYCIMGVYILYIFVIPLYYEYITTEQATQSDTFFQRISLRKTRESVIIKEK